MSLRPNANPFNSARLSKKAIVYLRQSTERQVTRNTESQRLQYALKYRARELGFERIEVIDSDLGCSAAIGSNRRPGFTKLLADITMGDVGMVLSRELSRLARTDKDWCHLLELCQLFDTLVADAERIYDLSSIDDQLILGIKGTMSAVELKILRMRMQQGLEEKARRGDLVAILPPGYIQDAMGKVVKDPDTRIRDAIELVFRKFREIGTVNATHMWFRRNGIELPVTKPRGGGFVVVWQLPTKWFLGHMLKNPCYAGAYCYGRRPTETTVVSGRPTKRRGAWQEPGHSKVFIRDHHEAYIEWTEFERNQETIRRNMPPSSRQAPGSVRGGPALLTGLLRCGSCGRKIGVRYPRRGSSAGTYRCQGERDITGERCITFAARALDQRVEEEILRVLSPLGIQASMAAIARGDSETRARRASLDHQLAQLEYEARRAFEQYDQVDPRQRLVAAELERRWNLKLEQIGEIKARIQQCGREAKVLSPEQKSRLLQLGADFSSIWNSDMCPQDLKKKIVRTMIEEIIIQPVDGSGRLYVVIRWTGGCHTATEVARPKSRIGQPNSTDDVDLIRRMAPRYSDAEIARVLGSLGRRTGKNRPWTNKSVATARRNYKIPKREEPRSDSEVMSLAKAARYCNVSNTTIKRLVAVGLVAMQQVAPTAPWEIRRSDLDSKPVRAALGNLRRTGKLFPQGTMSIEQGMLL
jgi:DNA invertase Pin-like site-specific DNA recombinase